MIDRALTSLPPPCPVLALVGHTVWRCTLTSPVCRHALLAEKEDEFHSFSFLVVILQVRATISYGPSGFSETGNDEEGRLDDDRPKRWRRLRFQIKSAVHAGGQWHTQTHAHTHTYPHTHIHTHTHLRSIKRTILYIYVAYKWLEDHFLKNNHFKHTTLAFLTSNPFIHCHKVLKTCATRFNYDGS